MIRFILFMRQSSETVANKSQSHSSACILMCIFILHYYPHYPCVTCRFRKRTKLLLYDTQSKWIGFWIILARFVGHFFPMWSSFLYKFMHLYSFSCYGVICSSLNPMEGNKSHKKKLNSAARINRKNGAKVNKRLQWIG